jgi:hypothetical protein
MESLHVMDVNDAEPSILWHFGLFSSTAEVLGFLDLPD